MEPRLAIALAIHEGACRLMPAARPRAAVDASREAMRLIIPEFDDISFDLVYLLAPHTGMSALEAQERLRHLAKDDTCAHAR